MTLADLLTIDGIALIVTVVGLFGGAMFWLGILHNKIETIEKDVDKLKDETRDLSIRLGVHVRSVEARQESERIREGSKDEH